jgi:hypothetical protein
MINQMFKQDGIIAFDDAYMPWVVKTISLLKRCFGDQEVAYSNHNQSFGLRLYHVLTRRSFHRPYRALKKSAKLMVKMLSRTGTGTGTGTATDVYNSSNW